jgi:hypothetical protein
MRARGDLIVFSEPFSASYYFSEDRVSDRFEIPATGTSAPSWSSVVENLRAAAEHGTVFVKEMAYHVAPCLSAEFVRAFQSTFIVRHPARALASLRERLPDFTVEEAGYEQQLRLMRLAREVSTDDLVVIDGDDLRRSPESVVAAYCRRTGLPHRPESLRWEPELLPDWEPWARWHEDVAASTGIRPPASEPDEGPPDGVDPELYARCVDLYEQMTELGRASGAG